MCWNNEPSCPSSEPTHFCQRISFGRTDGRSDNYTPCEPCQQYCCSRIFDSSPFRKTLLWHTRRRQRQLVDDEAFQPAAGMDFGGKGGCSPVRCTAKPLQVVGRINNCVDQVTFRCADVAMFADARSVFFSQLCPRPEYQWYAS